MNYAPLPLTVRRSIELVGLAVMFSIIIYARSIISPLIISFFFTILLFPVFRWLRNRKLPEMVAISICLLLLFIFMGLLVWFFSAQVSRLMADFPTLRNNVTIHLQNLSAWIDTKTHFSSDRQLALLNEQSNKLLNTAGGYLGGVAASVTSIFVFFGLVPIYIFLFLFYRNLLLRFIFSWFSKKDHEKLKETIVETQVIIKSYLSGLLIQIAYITILLGGALLLLGIKHALLIGVIFAILNLIPYVGALIGNIIGILLTLTSSQEVSPIFTVLITIAVVQFLDNNILMPRIVGSKVKINALASIVGVILGGTLAGISGMFLSLPVIAILKIIFDRSNNFKQWGILFGDERPKVSPFSFKKFRFATAPPKQKELPGEKDEDTGKSAS
jgi:predicted PurR-regulated permease PerM